MLPVCLRIARPVTDLMRSCAMYCSGLGLSKIGEFSDHQGFSGVMLGDDALCWHLEFTLCHHHPVTPGTSAEDLLVLYFPDKSHWDAVCQNMIAAGFSTSSSFNPYWDIAGNTFMDHDGYRVVIQNRAWP